MAGAERDGLLSLKADVCDRIFMMQQRCHAPDLF